MTNTSKLSRISVLPPHASDHSPLNIQISQPFRHKAILKTIFMYDHVDYDAINAAILAADWSYIEDYSIGVD